MDGTRDTVEWRLRQELAAAYRIFDHLGWTELIYNHITLRLPGPGHRFLINPFGLHYSEVRAGNLVTVDLEGRILGDDAWGVNPAGFVIHGAIHGAIEQAQCVMHTHTTAGMAVACKRHGLAMTNFYAAMLRDQVAYHDFEGITVNPEERGRLLASMGDRRLLILRNHGLLSWGGTVAEAFVRLWTLNRACEIQMASESMRGEDIPVPDHVADQASRAALQFNPRHGAGQDVFDALRRLVDAKDPTYRE
ncbi:MAG: class II aldolase/adducin family protein [Acetobacteraceae bacterium]|nr:class II aldolase/adducin family protein [Acetobacteraceae bacterium]